MISKLKGLGEYLTVMTGAFRIIMKTVKIAEDADIGEKNGEEKKELVLQVVGEIFEGLDDFVEMPISEERFGKVASKLVDLVVSFYNAVGVFR